MVMREVDIGLRPDPLHPTIQVRLVDCWVFIFVVMREVDIGIRPDNFLYITIVEYKFSTQGTFKKLYQGVCK